MAPIWQLLKRAKVRMLLRQFCKGGIHLKRIWELADEPVPERHLLPPVSGHAIFVCGVDVDPASAEVVFFVTGLTDNPHCCFRCLLQAGRDDQFVVVLASLRQEGQTARDMWCRRRRATKGTVRPCIRISRKSPVARGRAGAASGVVGQSVPIIRVLSRRFAGQKDRPSTPAAGHFGRCLRGALVVQAEDRERGYNFPNVGAVVHGRSPPPVSQWRGDRRQLQPNPGVHSAAERLALGFVPLAVETM